MSPEEKEVRLREFLGDYNRDYAEAMRSVEICRLDKLLERKRGNHPRGKGGLFATTHFTKISEHLPRLECIQQEAPHAAIDWILDDVIRKFQSGQKLEEMVFEYPFDEYGPRPGSFFVTEDSYKLMSTEYVEDAQGNKRYLNQLMVHPEFRKMAALFNPVRRTFFLNPEDSISIDGEDYIFDPNLITTIGHELFGRNLNTINSDSINDGLFFFSNGSRKVFMSYKPIYDFKNINLIHKNNFNHSDAYPAISFLPSEYDRKIDYFDIKTDPGKEAERYLFSKLYLEEGNDISPQALAAKRFCFEMGNRMCLVSFDVVPGRYIPTKIGTLPLDATEGKPQPTYHYPNSSKPVLAFGKPLLIDVSDIQLDYGTLHPFEPTIDIGRWEGDYFIKPHEQSSPFSPFNKKIKVHKIVARDGKNEEREYEVTNDQPVQLTDGCKISWGDGVSFRFYKGDLNNYKVKPKEESKKATGFTMSIRKGFESLFG